MAFKAFLLGINSLGLKYCATDADQLSLTLQRLNYETTVGRNDKYVLQAEFDSFLDQVTSTDTIVLYFSGHGVIEKGKLWLLLSDDGSKPANKVNVNDFLEAFSDCRAKNRLAVLDCCHAGQGIVDLKLDLSDEFLILAASSRLEKTIEVESLKSSLLTYFLYMSLNDALPSLLDDKNSLTIHNLYRWLCDKIKKYNLDNDHIASLPRLLGSHSDFALVTLSSGQHPEHSKSMAEERSLQAVEQRYRTLLLDSCDIVSLANLPEQDRHLATRPLELRRLYAPLRVWVDHHLGNKIKDADWDEIEKRRYRSIGGHGGQSSCLENLRASVGEQLSDARRLVVLGDPGAGKTTLLRWIATAYLLRLKGDENWRDLPDVKNLPDFDWMPIIIRCRDLDATALVGTLDDILGHTLRKAEIETDEASKLQRALRERLKAGTALVMLDGLDEITDPTLRATFCQQLERIHLAYRNAPMIVTSRIVGYREMGFRLERGFQHVTLADLEPDEKDDFARRWCDLTELPERRADAARELIHDIHSSDRIERMTGNPMLLTTMALVKRKVGKLPSRRADLYGEAVQVLLNWRREVDEPLDPHEAIPQLEYVAYAMCDKGVQHLRRDEFLTLIKQMRDEYPNLHQARNHVPEEFLNRLEARTGLLVEAGRTRHLGLEEIIYEFRHLTFQEYLAARALVAGHYAERIREPLASKIAPLAGRMVETAFTRGGEKELAVVENWREAIRLCVAMCRDDDVDSVLGAIVTPLTGEPESTSRARAILAALCLADEPNASEESASAVLKTFAAQVSRRDRNFEIRTGIHVAAVSLAESRWGYLLCQYLTQEFLERAPLLRDHWGDVLGLAYAKTAPLETAALSAWWERQIKLVVTGTEPEAIQVALGICAKLSMGKSPQIIPDVISSLMSRLNGSSPMAHAAAEALAYLHSLEFWTPDQKAQEQLLKLVATPAYDPEAVRFLYWIFGEDKTVAAIDATTLWLEHPSRDLRAQLVQALQQIGTQRATDLVSSKLDDPDPDVRGSAAAALGHLRDENSVHRLIPLLNDPEAEVRMAAVAALGAIGAEVAVEPLGRKLDDEDSAVRTEAIWSLGRFKAEYVENILIHGARQSELDICIAASTMLGRLKSELAIEVLVCQLKNEAPGVRVAAAEALGEIGSDKAVNALIGLLKDSDAEVRTSAVTALGDIKGDGTVELLTPFLNDKDVEIRCAVARALGALKSAGGLHQLKYLLHDAEADVRGAAASALGGIRTEEAVGILLTLLTDPVVDVRKAAVRALGIMGSDRAVVPLLAMLKKSENTTRNVVALALGDLGSEEAVEVLISLLLDADFEIRAAAAIALGKIGSDRAVEALVSALDGKDAYIRHLAGRALGEIGSERAVELLLPLLNSKDRERSTLAANVLGKLRSEQAIDPLISQLDAPFPYLRRAAVRALGDIGHQRSKKVLNALLQDDDVGVRVEASEALSRDVKAQPRAQPRGQVLTLTSL